MPWSGTIETEEGKTFCITTGATMLDGSIRIALSKQDLEGLTDEELIYNLRDFQRKADIIQLIGYVDECNWNLHYISRDDLLAIATSDLADEETRERAHQYLVNPLAALDPDPSPRKKMPGFVYLFSSDNHSQLYKIGYSVDPKRRMKQVGFCTLFYQFPADNMSKAEDKLHYIYHSERIEGEWFKLDEGDLEYLQSIKEYRNGEFVIEG